MSKILRVLPAKGLQEIQAGRDAAEWERRQALHHATLKARCIVAAEVRARKPRALPAPVVVVVTPAPPDFLAMVKARKARNQSAEVTETAPAPRPAPAPVAPVAEDWKATAHAVATGRVWDMLTGTWI